MDDDECCKCGLFSIFSASLLAHEASTLAVENAGMPPPLHHLAANQKHIVPAFSQINDRLEFPLELNMHPYTKEGRAATAATEEVAQRHAKTGDENDDEVSVWPFVLP